MTRRPLASKLAPFMYILPAFLFLFVFTYLPVFRSLYLSFFRSGIGQTGKGFAGFDNYADVFASRTFYLVLSNTIVFSISTIVLGMSLGLFLAVQINKRIAVNGLFKFSLFYPSMIPMAAAGLIWMWIYIPTYGLLDHLMNGLGLGTRPWLYKADSALWCMVVVSIWKHVGYYMILFLAGMKNISEELIDAAKIEGAGAIRCFWSITFPMLSSYTFFIFIMNVIDSLRSTDLVYIMTQGAPDHATNMIVYYIYQQSFRYWNTGFASALTSLLVGFFLVCVIVLFSTVGKKVYYEA
jgi:ABC-type sugar transport system permease subunit